MIILGHRGLWQAPEERNRKVAFERCFESGFGTETDLRDRAGGLVIAHDMASPADLSLDELLDILAGRSLPLALNIKADGLGPLLAERMRARGHTAWFTFDMTVPELVVQLRLGLPAFTRASEHERQPPCYAAAAGIWLDSFERLWFSRHDLLGFLGDGKRVAVVSPELHGRDPVVLWALLKAAGLAGHPGLMLCTDRPVEAATYFNLQQEERAA